MLTSAMGALSQFVEKTFTLRKSGIFERDSHWVHLANSIKCNPIILLEFFFLSLWHEMSIIWWFHFDHLHIWIKSEVYVVLVFNTTLKYRLISPVSRVLRSITLSPLPFPIWFPHPSPYTSFQIFCSVHVMFYYVLRVLSFLV